MAGPRHVWLVSLGILAAGRAAAEAPAPARVTVRATPVPLDTADPGIHACGRLQYLGGVALAADDPRFGGFSTLIVSPDGRWITSVSDEGRWLHARVVYDGDGRLTGLDEATLGILLKPAGAPLEHKAEQDAESLTLLADGSMLVGFEHQHRLWRYGALSEAPTPFPGPKGLEKAPSNGGVESLASLPGGRILALTEFWMARSGVRGWIDDAGRWKDVRYQLQGSHRPSDACATPEGDLLVLERAYNPQRGIVSVRLMRVAARDVDKGDTLRGTLVAELRPPFVLDNFEGLACRRGAEGETIVYLISDDNFSKVQRTLLLMFSLQ
jgi:hypothetical protein